MTDVAGGVYGTGFATGFLAGIGAKDRSEGLKLVLVKSLRRQEGDIM